MSAGAEAIIFFCGQYLIWIKLFKWMVIISLLTKEIFKFEHQHLKAVGLDWMGASAAVNGCSFPACLITEADSAVSLTAASKIFIAFVKLCRDALITIVSICDSLSVSFM